MRCSKPVQWLVLLILPGLFYTLCACSSSRSKSRKIPSRKSLDQVEPDPSGDVTASRAYMIQSNSKKDDRTVRESLGIHVNSIETDRTRQKREELILGVYLETRPGRSGLLYQNSNDEGMVFYRRNPSAADTQTSRGTKEDILRRNTHAVQTFTPAQPEWSRNELRDIVSGLRTEREKRDPEFSASVLQEEDDLKVYTAAIMYYRDVIDQFLGQGVGQVFQELAEELNSAYNWKLNTGDDFQRQMAQLSSDETFNVDNGPIESSTSLPVIQRMTIDSFLDKNITISPDISLDTSDQHIDYGLGFELHFMPGNSELYLNGPEESLKLTIKLNY